MLITNDKALQLQKEIELFCLKDEDDQFRSRFDRTFPDAPGSPGWWEWKFRDF
jgi:hypothetical protein